MKRWALVTAPVAIAVAGLVSLGGAGPSAVGIGAVGVMAGSTSVPVVTYSRACEKTAQTQMALDECAYTELKEVQRQLAAVLGREAKGTSHSLIVAAETGFAGYEKAECTVRAYVNRGGSIYPMIFTECETALTVQRIQSVLEYLSELPA